MIKRKRKFQKKAENHRRTVLKRKIFQLWITHVRKVWEHKVQLADNFYMKITKRFAFRAWLVYHNGERSKYLVAVDWYELKITEAIFQQWLGLMKLQKLIEATKSIQAVSHYNWFVYTQTKVCLPTTFSGTPTTTNSSILFKGV